MLQKINIIGKIIKRNDKAFNIKIEDINTVNINTLTFNINYNEANAANPQDYAFLYDSAKKMPDNIGIPPYHYNCRTEYVAFFAEFEAEADKYREYPVEYKRNLTNNPNDWRVIKGDAFYTAYNKSLHKEIVLDTDGIWHIERESNRNRADAESAMEGEFIATAPHRNGNGEMIAVSKVEIFNEVGRLAGYDYYVVVFQGGNHIRTAFVKSGGKKAAQDYFNKSVLPSHKIRSLKSVFSRVIEWIKN